MDRKNWKAFYLKKGKYDDGRERIVIAWYTPEGFRKIQGLPKPEELLDILKGRCDRPLKIGEIKGKLRDGKIVN